MHPLDPLSPVRTKDGKMPTADGHALHQSSSRMTSGSSGEHPPRPPSSASTASSASSTSSKHVKCIGRYVLLAETLGKGNFARVEAAVHTLTKSRVAIKIIETDKIKEEYVKKNLLREAQLMRRLRHPNIIRLYETMKTNTLYCLVTEVAEGGELLSHVRNDCKEKRLPEGSARMFVRQLISALDYLHSAGIVHRDLKMENILLDRKKKSIKIVDFGLSNAQKPGALLQTHCGSPEYAAPELFIPGREYGPEVDVWSLGVNMYAMLVGKLPFRSPRQGAKRRQKLLEQISSGLMENHYKEMEHLSASSVDLIAHLLQPNPAKRAQLFEAMVHPWITRDGLQPLEPYKQPAIDHSLQTAVMELMSASVEVSVAEIRETVRRDRCDWLAAIFNLLIDYPEGRMSLHKTMVNGDRNQSMGGSQESLNGTSGFSQGLSQDVLELTEAGLIQPAKKAYPRIVDNSRPATEFHDGPPSMKEKRRAASHSQGEKALHNFTYQPPSTRHAPAHHSTLTAPSLSIRRASVASPLTSPEHVTVPAGRRLPQTPSPDYRDETMSPTHVRRESAPKPLPQPFRASIATQNELYANGKPRHHSSQTGDYEQGYSSMSYKPVYSPTPAPMIRPALSQDSELADPMQPGGPKKVLSPLRPKSTAMEHSHMYGRHHGSMKEGLNDQAMYTTWKGHKRHVVGPKYQSGAGRHSLDSSQIPVPNGWSGVSSNMYGGSVRKLSPTSQEGYAARSPSDNMHQSLKDLRQHPASHMTPENEHGMGLVREVSTTNRSDLELVTEMFTPRGHPYGMDPHAMPLSQDSGLMLKGDPSFEGRLRKPKSMEQLKRSLPRPKTVSLGSSSTQANGEFAMSLMSPSDSRTVSSNGKHQRLPSIEELQTKRPHSSRSRSISGFLGRALKITSFKSKSGDK